MPEPSTGLTSWDWAVIAAYGAGMIALGALFARRQQSTAEYFVGRGQVHWGLVGVSLFATLLSTITYLATPGELIAHGPGDLSKLMVLPIVFFIVAYGMLPAYMKHRVTSAYELLEARLGLSHRLAGVFMFLVLRLIWMSVLIYMASDALVVVLGLDRAWIPAVIAATGAVSVLYTTLGGLRAVVITDFVQTIVLLGGACLVVVLVTVHMGGFGWIPSARPKHWDTQPFFSFDPSTRVTLVNAMLSLGVWYLCTAGGDQVSVQRFMATRDLRAAQRSYAVQIGVSIVVQLVLALVGLALLAYYTRFADHLPPGMTLKEHGDKIFPLFIRQALPPGVAGLVVAAMLAAAMSSIDSGVNSIAAVVVTDVLDRLGHKPRSDRSHMRAARFLAAAIGASVILGSIGLSLLDPKAIGNFTEIAHRTVNLLVPAMFCLFFFALFVPGANAPGVWLGTLASVASAVLIAYSGPIFGFVERDGEHLAPVSFQWTGPASLLCGLAAGWLGCRLFAPKGNGSERA